VHGITTLQGPAAWRPNAAWLGLAIVVVVASLGTNLAEIVYVYVLHDPRAILARRPIDRVFDDFAATNADAATNRALLGIRG